MRISSSLPRTPRLLIMGSISPLTVSLSPYQGAPHESWLAEEMLISCCYSSWVYSNCLLLGSPNINCYKTSPPWVCIIFFSFWIPSLLEWPLLLSCNGALWATHLLSSYCVSSASMGCFIMFWKLPALLFYLTYPSLSISSNSVHVGQLHFIFCSLGVEPLFSGKVWYSHG